VTFFHPSIKFTYEIDDTKVTFLDVNIFKCPDFNTKGKLGIETYIKPTNPQLYLHVQSFHPPGSGKSVALGEMKRYLRTNSRANKFYDFKSKHKINLLRRGYSMKFIKSCINRVQYKDRLFDMKAKLKIERKHTIPFDT